MEAAEHVYDLYNDVNRPKELEELCGWLADSEWMDGESIIESIPCGSPFEIKLAPAGELKFLLDLIQAFAPCKTRARPPSE